MGSNPIYDRPSLSQEVTPKERELLVRLMEECSEVIQSVSKVLRWGWDSCHPDDSRGETNEASMNRELRDVADLAKRIQSIRDKKRS